MSREHLTKLRQTKGKCEVCGLKADVVHHLDGDVFNSQPKNLSALCYNCRGVVKRRMGMRRTSKFLRLYGMTLTDMSETLGISSSYVYQQLNDPKRRKEILEQLGLKETLP